MIKTKMAERLKSNQMSDTFTNAIFLTLSGGFQDAYTYLCRGKFSQTLKPEILCLWAHIFFEGEFGLILHYLIPVISFIFGIFFFKLFKFYKHFIKRKIRNFGSIINIILVVMIIKFICQFFQYVFQYSFINKIPFYSTDAVIPPFP